MGKKELLKNRVNFLYYEEKMTQKEILKEEQSEELEEDNEDEII